MHAGVGRAYQPHEFIGLGVPMDKSREMLAEGLDIVSKAWTQEKIANRGQFWATSADRVMPRSGRCRSPTAAFVSERSDNALLGRTAQFSRSRPQLAPGPQFQMNISHQ